ncbi:hypothetical protein [Natrarchaeobaculum aegyptiacum]|uniref:Uncharacterized protein n=1 Tax=Natrarchaeobaculum aegyptiacum TaxID=745377 RepID=A0A2Z2HT12_9EURY|nr:hypothetical protein [Natrarchaeobaculum aegyptiacum]ARS90356.1 hypothetical protein B1756_11890 [Natrarchaeobaculum aegyptiacum]
MTDPLPADLADAWRPVATLTDERSIVAVSITAETTVYEPVEPPATTPVEASLPLRSLFVTDLSVSPSLSTIGLEPTGLLSVATSQAKTRFVDVVEERGVTVDGVRDTIAFETPSGEPGKWHVLEATYPLVADETPADADSLTAEAHVVVWPTDSSFGVVGGTHPLEAVDDRPVDPERDRDRIARLVRSVGGDAPGGSPAE